MDDFESVYLQDEFNNSASTKRLCPMDRLKIGEVFQVRHNQFVFVCIHCTQEFQQFTRFTAHIQNHYHNALQWIAPQSEMNDMPIDIQPSATVNMENVEWLFSDSSNDSVENGEQPYVDVECKVNIREGVSDNTGGDGACEYEDTEMGNDDTFDSNVSLETRFKLKHPLIRVKDMTETRELLPYFSKKYSFKRIDERFQCPLCDYSACSKANIREHIFTHSEVKMFSCKLCNKDFSRPRNIILHIEQKHSDVAVLTPDRHQAKRLKIEKIDAIANVNQTNNFSISPKSKFNSKILYSNEVNGDKTRSQCYICMKTFSRPNGIIKHLKTHTQERNYTCFQCGSQFSRSDHLNRHMLIHEDPKFKCDICDMVFRRSDKLLSHRRKHPETMNYTCENCGLGFMELNSVKTHVNFHCKVLKPPLNATQMNFDSPQTTDLNIETHPVNFHCKDIKSPLNTTQMNFESSQTTDLNIETHSVSGPSANSAQL
ncbi:zinc finger protein 16-like [Contarinia nasturtii]|uniref:zinc finger protein 16-like n=1 Tax=Contarinia nasturtii TaxID=265458 RepID=UPI0012D48132|nr:zinc finger protein 16-like [Contarinia nasturtii]